LFRTSSFENLLFIVSAAATSIFSFAASVKTLPCLRASSAYSLSVGKEEFSYREIKSKLT
jgi:hypothetical protein